MVNIIYYVVVNSGNKRLILCKEKVLMGDRIFPVVQIGMNGRRANVEIFGKYVHDYFANITGIHTIRLSFESDYTATVIAFRSIGKPLKAAMIIDSDELRAMLAGFTRELDSLGVCWRSMDTTITRMGVVTGKILW